MPDDALPLPPAPGLATRPIAAPLAAIRDRIAAAARAAGRAPEHVTLVAVSKTHPAEAIVAALHAGQRIFGENRVQEAAAKFAPLRAGWPGLRLHLIGALQTNKAADAIAIADMIESLDRPRLADALLRAAERAGRLPGLLVQINVGDEPQKAGIPTTDADAFITECRARFGERLLGLMAIPPAQGDPTPHFTWLARAADRHRLAVVSMGMSGDFEAAIAAGSTQVRVGSALFGVR